MLKMQSTKSVLLLFATSILVEGFIPTPTTLHGTLHKTCKGILHVSIGLGPGSEEDQLQKPVVDEEIIPEPNHELFRDSRLTEFDKQCDSWYGTMLTGKSFLGPVSEEARRRLNTLVKLERQVRCILFQFIHLSLGYQLFCEKAYFIR